MRNANSESDAGSGADTESVVVDESANCCLIIIMIMVIIKCYFSGEHSHFINKNNNGVNIELGKTNRLKAL